MEYGQSFHNTKFCDNYINCFSDSNFRFSKYPVILGTLNGNIISTDLAKWKSTCGPSEVYQCDGFHTYDVIYFIALAISPIYTLLKFDGVVDGTFYLAIGFTFYETV